MPRQCSGTRRSWRPPFVSSVKLTATVSAAMIETAGTGWVTVVTPGSVCNPGGGTSNVMYLPVVNMIPSLKFADNFSRRNGQHSGRRDAARRICRAHHFDLHGCAGPFHLQRNAEFIHGDCDADQCRCVACDAGANVCAGTVFTSTLASEATICLSARYLRLASGVVLDCSEQGT